MIFKIPYTRLEWRLRERDNTVITDTYCRLSVEIEDWLDAHLDSWELVWTYGGIYELEILDPNVAVLFKLTWL